VFCVGRIIVGGVANANAVIGRVLVIDDEDEVVLRGAFDYIRKPFHLEQLYRSVTAALTHHTYAV
jgi:DNA-binding NtrC family response regulator